MNAKQIVRENWKPVTISGMTGILMGAGTMYASQKLTTDEMPAVVESNELPLQEASVEGCKSFRDAFEAARAELGAGGVFRWHGNIYSTYTAEEWNAMSQAQKNDFAQQVRPEIPAHRVITPTDDQPDVVVHQNDTKDVSEANENITDDGDVHIVGYANVQGHLAVGLDMTGDGDADVAIIDVDDNRQLSNPDLIVDKDGNMATFGEIVNEEDSHLDTYIDDPDTSDADVMDSDQPLFDC